MAERLSVGVGPPDGVSPGELAREFLVRPEPISLDDLVLLHEQASVLARSSRLGSNGLARRRAERGPSPHSKHGATLHARADRDKPPNPLRGTPHLTKLIPLPPLDTARVRAVETCAGLPREGRIAVGAHPHSPFDILRLNLAAASLVDQLLRL